MACVAGWGEGALTFLAGGAGFLRQPQSLQVEGVAVVPEGHPGPVPQGGGALPRIHPLVKGPLV